MYDVIEGREELAEVEMQKTSYQEGDSEEELSRICHEYQKKQNSASAPHFQGKQDKS